MRIRQTFVIEFQKILCKKPGKHLRRDFKMEKFYFKKKIGFVASNLLWENLKRKMAKDS